MRGRWAAGIVPRNFCWIIKDHLAVSERPGGYSPNHRKVRRQEELLWLRAQGFTRVVSLLGSTHNLHAYEELGLEWSRFPLPASSETPLVLGELYPAMHRWLRSGERLLLHQEELGDCVMGVSAGYLLWSEILPDGPRAITAMEQLLRRQMGTVGRMIVAAVDEVPSVRSNAVHDTEPGAVVDELSVPAPIPETEPEPEPEPEPVPAPIPAPAPEPAPAPISEPTPTPTSTPSPEPIPEPEPPQALSSVAEELVAVAEPAVATSQAPPAQPRAPRTEPETSEVGNSPQNAPAGSVVGAKPMRSSDLPEHEEDSADDTEPVPDEAATGGDEPNQEPERELNEGQEPARIDEGEGLAAGLS